MHKLKLILSLIFFPSLIFGQVTQQKWVAPTGGDISLNCFSYSSISVAGEMAIGTEPFSVGVFSGSIGYLNNEDTINCISVGNENINTLSEIKLFPNPNNGSFTLKIQTTGINKGVVVITDALGRVFQTREIINLIGDNSHFFTGFYTGIYFLKYFTSSQQYTIKIIVE